MENLGKWRGKMISLQSKPNTQPVWLGQNAASEDVLGCDRIGYLLIGNPTCCNNFFFDFTAIYLALNCKGQYCSNDLTNAVFHKNWVMFMLHWATRLLNKALIIVEMICSLPTAYLYVDHASSVSLHLREGRRERLWCFRKWLNTMCICRKPFFVLFCSPTHMDMSLCRKLISAHSSHSPHHTRTWGAHTRAHTAYWFI